MAKIGSSDLDVHGLNLGGNVFGWTADQDTSFAVLDAYTAAGGNFIDTADAYQGFNPDKPGDGSEAVLGAWLAKRGRRDDIVIATKVGSLKSRPGLTAKNIAAAAEESLKRLRTDHIDLYYAHRDYDDAPLEETLGAFDALVRSGKVRYIAASNYTAARLEEALSISERQGFAKYVALQPHYNLLEREYEQELAPLIKREGLSTLPYFGLAKGFLAGKYRSKDASTLSPRAKGAMSYLDERGERVLGVLDEIAASHGVSVAAVSLAWLAAQPTVTAPIASARNTEQLAELLPFVDLKLTDDELKVLTDQ
jgi:aryl-alcohol dehydrogenase-like predicted oxidoreductase